MWYYRENAWDKMSRYSGKCTDLGNEERKEIIKDVGCSRYSLVQNRKN